MTSPTVPRHLTRRRLLTAGLGAVLAACAGVTEGTDVETAAPTGPTDDPTTAADPAPSPASTDAAPAPAPTPTFEQRVLPTGIDPHRIRIDAIGVDAPVIDLTITADEVEVPEDFDATGWWVQTRKPGEIGPSVIGGHVDSKRGPAVFFDLRRLDRGDEVVVAAEDGSTRTFVVDRVIQIDKYDRPPEVFGFGEARPELRLITCGGDFNPSIGHYTDNIVVFCHDASFQA